MLPHMRLSPDYMEEMKRRAKESHVYQKHQSVGLALAEILNDPKHKALYIRLAKTVNESTLIELAKSVAGRKNIKNAGAYFMRLLYKDGKPKTLHHGK